MRINYDLISNKLILSQEINYNFLKTEIQNNITLDIATREVGIDFINFLKKKNVTTILELNKYSKEFYNYKKRIVGNIQANEVFLADYYGVLEDTLLQIQNPEQFFIKYNIENKFEILDVAIGLNKKYIDENEGVKTISESGFTEFKNRRVGGFKRKRTLFIDEAQDCHRLEKEILLSIYGSDNIVIANGGKEQLIRHVEMCNWEIFQTKKISIKKHYTRNKSYRVKKTIVDFCNFVANKFNIDLNLEPLESEDEGELIFDFRQNHSEVEISDIFNHLNLKGKVNGCSAYESLLILLEANSQRNGIDRDENSEKAVINEYGNIEDSTNLRRGTWDYLETLKKNGFMFWDGTIGNKSELIPPSQNESRIIYYESCRGLEAWSVACFAMDKFFNQKREEPDAEKYLIEDLFLNQDNEQRKNMFATTWLIMAMTRVIDTLYIQVNDRNSTFGKIVDEYINQKNKNVREITNIASH